MGIVFLALLFANNFFNFFSRFRDRHNIATKKDKVLCVFMIVLAVFSNLVAIYSDAYALFKKNAAPRAA